MNTCFITASISKKCNITTDNTSDYMIRFSLKTPSTTDQFLFYNIEAFAFGELAVRMSELCIKGDYIFLEGSVLIDDEFINPVTDDESFNIVFLIDDIQPIF